MKLTGGTSQSGGAAGLSIQGMLRHRKYQIAALAVLASALAAAWIWYDVTARDRTCGAAISAIERQDADALFALTVPSERQALGVTPASIRATLGPALWRFGPMRRSRVTKLVEQPDRCDYVVEWQDLHGNPIRGTLAEPNPITNRNELYSVLTVARRNSGWRLNYTALLWGMTSTIWPFNEARANYRQMCEQAGISGHMNENMRIERFAGDPQE